MDINDTFAEMLKKRCVEVQIGAIALTDNNITKKIFPELIKRGKKGELIKVVLQGKTYYSFMSEDELYKTFAGKAKAEYEVYQTAKEKYDKRVKEKEKQQCVDIKSKKLPEWKKAITESFPTEQAKSLLKSINDRLSRADLSVIVVMDNLVSMLNLAKKDPNKALMAYRESTSNPENRLYNYGRVLVSSFYGEEFLPELKKDIRIEYAYEDEADIRKLIAKYEKEALDAKSQRGSQPE